MDGVSVGCNEGLLLVVGVIDGCTDGGPDGVIEGFNVGLDDGLRDGGLECKSVGTDDGEVDGMGDGTIGIHFLHVTTHAS